MRFFLVVASAWGLTAFLLSVTPIRAATAAPGGSHQLGAVQGCTNQWLFNGVWRLRVLKVEPATRELVNYPGYAITLEVRNGAKKTTSMAYSGVSDGGIIALDDGNTLDQETESQIAWHTPYFKDLPPGAGFTQTLKFFYPNVPATVAKPQKYLLEIDSKKEGTTAPRYTTKDPTFRVNLTCG